MCSHLILAFSHWIVERTPLVTVKAAMTLDGKIATASGESKWITGAEARACGMKLREGTDAILVGINTVLADDPSLTFRPASNPEGREGHRLRRLVLDTRARTPLTARVVTDEFAELTTIVVSILAPRTRVAALSRRVRVLVVPMAKHPPAPGTRYSAIDLGWLLRELGKEQVTSLLVEGGGEVNASFLEQGLAQRVVCFYASKVLGGRDSRPAVGGSGARSLDEALQLSEVEWKRIGQDLMLLAKVGRRAAQRVG